MGLVLEDEAPEEDKRGRSLGVGETEEGVSSIDDMFKGGYITFFPLSKGAPEVSK